MFILPLDNAFNFPRRFDSQRLYRSPRLPDSKVNAKGSISPVDPRMQRQKPENKCGGHRTI